MVKDLKFLAFAIISVMVAVFLILIAFYRG